jgi:site-specific DNA-methyltransferase (adenine-specific)
MIDLRQGDCLEIMKLLPDGCIDAIITDPPYGTTACKWDSVIPFEPMWAELKRIIKPSGAIVLFGSQPFTSALIMSNAKMFKYEWIWEKAVGSNFATVKYQPMKEHENVLIFGNGKINYYPQMQERKGTCKGKVPNYTNTKSKSVGLKTEVYNSLPSNRDGKVYDVLRNPSSVQFFNNRISNDRGNHPTQKPVALLEYLIKTYTKENETVLDFTMGSGTTGVACKNLNRNFIGIELDETYFNIAKERIGD